MRIGIDARLYKKGLGIGRYIEQLLFNLELVDSDDEFYIFLRSEMMDVYNPKNPRFKKICLDVSWYSLAEQIIVPFVMVQYRLDLVHFPHFNVPLIYPGKFVVTIHDLIMIKHADSSKSAASTRNVIVHWLKYRCYTVVLWIACFRAKHIISVSNCVKNDLMKIVGVSGKKITVIHEGVQLFAGSVDSTLPNEVTKPYFINVGNAYPHKNIALLLAVFEMYKKQNQPYQLVLCGQEDYFRDKVLEEIDSRSLREHVVHLGYVRDSQLAALYKNAQAALFPSFEEGFGFGALEAAAQEIPIIASDIPCFRETLGDAALYIDPTDVNDMIRAIHRIESDAGIRKRLIDQGMKQVQRFSWTQAAEQTYAIYHLKTL